MQRKFVMTFYVPGTGADWAAYWTVPSDCQLVHVSAVSSAAQNGTFTIGDSADPDEFLTASAIGDSGTPNEFDYDDFVDSDGNTHNRYYPHITDGTVMVLTVDTDGGVSGTADDCCIVLTFVEG
jgi:hypothetical protein